METKELKSLPSGRTQQRCYVECQVKNNTNRHVTVYICHCRGDVVVNLHANETLPDPIPILQGATAVVAFDTKTEELVALYWLNLTAPSIITVG